MPTTGGNLPTEQKQILLMTWFMTWVASTSHPNQVMSSDKCLKPQERLEMIRGAVFSLDILITAPEPLAPRLVGQQNAGRRPGAEDSFWDQLTRMVIITKRLGPDHVRVDQTRSTSSSPPSPR